MRVAMKRFQKSHPNLKSVRQSSPREASDSRRSSTDGGEILSLGNSSSSDELSSNDVRPGSALLMQVQENGDVSFMNMITDNDSKNMNIKCGR